MRYPPPMRGFWALFAAAFAVRVAAAAVLGIDGPAVGDERGYMLIAEALVRGDGFALPVPGEVVAGAGLSEVAPLRAFRAPLWPILLAPVAGFGVTAARVLALVIGSLAAPLLWIVLRRGSLGRNALWPALACAAWPPLVYLSLRALSESLAVTLVLGAVALLGRAGEARRSVLAAGVAAGLAVLAKPAVLVACLFLAVAARSRKAAVWFVVALAVVLAPWLVRNVAVVGAPVLTTNSGVTLVGGNCAAAAAAEAPGKWVPPDRAYEARSDGPDLWMWGWSSLGEVGSDRRFRSDALRWVGEHPAAAAGLACWKVVRLFDPDPHSSRADAGLKRWVGWGTLLPVLLLALAGLPTAWRDRREWVSWAALLAGTTAVAIVFYGDSRMRIAADPALLALAGAGGLALCRRAFGTEIAERVGE
jgi:4-amino-4-deoxy-L-arabinose transferase-like glycosyltransferase